MGRKRKVPKEDDTSNNTCQETTSEEEKLLSHTDGSLDIKEAAPMNVETTERPDSTVTDVGVRRSTRVKTPVSRFRTQKDNPSKSNACLETPCEEKIQSKAINVESEKEEVATQVQQVSSLQAPDEIRLVQEEPQIHEFHNLEEKVDYIVRAVDEFKSKDTEWLNEGQSTRMNYKTLYMNSQRKIEEMMEKNLDLVVKLEFAHGKIEAYEKMMVVTGGRKEMMLVPSQAKATEASKSLSPQMVQGGISMMSNGPNDDAAADIQNQKQKASSPKQRKKYQKRKSKQPP